jgi:DNA-binding response OmpR family regulator
MSGVGPFPPSDPSARIKVLFFDWNRARFRGLIDHLEAMGLEVHHEARCARFVDRVREIKPDLVVANLFVEQQAVLSYLKEVRPELDKRGARIIVVTGHYSASNVLECKKNGIVEVIPEPWDKNGLQQKIEEHLPRRHAKEDPNEVLRQSLRLLHEALRLLAEHPDPHAALHETLRLVAQLGRSPRVNVTLGEVKDDSLSVLATSDDSNLRDRTLQMSRYPEVKEVLSKGSPLYVRDLGSHPLTQEMSRVPKGVTMSSMYILPVRVKGETLATLNVRMPPGEDELPAEMIEAFEMIALAIAPKVAAKRLVNSIKRNKAA